jgi:hypothetical protein
MGAVMVKSKRTKRRVPSDIEKSISKILRDLADLRAEVRALKKQGITIKPVLMRAKDRDGDDSSD